MKQNIPYELASLAFKKNDLHRFFTGEPPYNFVDKYSPAPGPADLSDLIYLGLLPYLNKNASKENISYLESSLKELTGSPEGMYGVAAFILQAFIYAKKKDNKIYIDLNEIAFYLRKSIEYNKNKIIEIRVKLDPRSNLYETLEILSKNTKRIGGPSFFPEEKNEDESAKA